METLGEKIEKILEEKGMSQRQLAIKMGISPSSLNQYVRGHKNVGLKVILKLCKTLDVSSDYLLGLETGAKKNKKTIKNIDALWDFLSVNTEKSIIQFDVLNAEKPLYLISVKEIGTFTLNESWCEQTYEKRSKDA